jgi:SAM-dependent methyltransferase
MINFQKKYILLFPCSNLLFALDFSDIDLTKDVYLNAGMIADQTHYKEYIGLDLTLNNKDHICFDLTKRMPLPDNSVDRFHSEDTFEHIEYSELPKVLNEVFRVLKVGGRMRLALPDYRCDVLYHRTVKDTNGSLLFDAGGGGYFKDGKVCGGGHVWFPSFENVTELLAKSLFNEKSEVIFYHYYDQDGKGQTNEIDYTLGWVQRTPDNDKRVMVPYRPMSIVVDCIKLEN